MIFKILFIIFIIFILIIILFDYILIKISKEADEKAKEMEVKNDGRKI